MAVDLANCTDKELDALIEDLRHRIISHEPDSDDFEIMVKNSVLMSAYTTEKQKRNSEKSGRHSMKIAYIAIFISLLSLDFSYWQTNQEITINSEQFSTLIKSVIGK